MTDEQKYKYACYLYYNALGDVQSPLTDAEFDALQMKLGKEKTEAFTVGFSLTPEEIEEALEWSMVGSS